VFEISLENKTDNCLNQMKPAFSCLQRNLKTELLVKRQVIHKKDAAPAFIHKNP